MGSEDEKRVSAESLEKAEAVLLKMKPVVAEMFEKLGPANREVSFDEIESAGGARGDLLGRLLMQEVVAAQDTATDLEIEQARIEALKRAAPELSKKFKPSDLRLVRMRDKKRTLKTARGEVSLQREYLYFPDLKIGIFPPRDSTEDSPR